MWEANPAGIPSSTAWPSLFFLQLASFETHTAVTAAAGEDFSVVVNSQGEAFSWGSGKRGQLGQGRYDKKRGQSFVPLLPLA